MSRFGTMQVDTKGEVGEGFNGVIHSNEGLTGYKSRALNGPPYFNTSFKHFFTVVSLFAYE